MHHGICLSAECCGRMSASLFVPEFKWAQNKEVLFLTIEIVDVQKPKISLTDTSLSFSGSSGKAESKDSQSYSLSIEFLHEIDASQSKYAIRGRGIELVLHKKDTQAEFWPICIKNAEQFKGKFHVDWNKWVDEDEEEHEVDDWRAKMGGDFNPIDFPEDDDEEEDEAELEEVKPLGEAAPQGEQVNPA